MYIYKKYIIFLYFAISREDSNSNNQNVIDPAKVAHAHLNEFNQQQQVEPLDYREIECVINEEYTVNCRREGNDVYMPFSFISKYFEVGQVLGLLCFSYYIG